MTADSVPQAVKDAIDQLEQRIQELRDDNGKSQEAVEQLRRQLHGVFETMDEHKTSIREVDAKLTPYRTLPEQLRGIGDHTERIAQDVIAARAELVHSVRLLQTESTVNREEGANASRRIESVAAELDLLSRELTQVQAQIANTSQSSQTVLERQRVVESSVEQLALRLDRTVEVHKNLEERIREVLLEDQKARFDIVFERLQVVGEMVRRNEELIHEATAEQTLREDVLQEIGVWRDQHTRVEGRLGGLEESADEILSQVDRLQAEITLVEGRHTGLSERVATIRRDIAEVVDHVRDEFANFNQMVEKQRRKQIQSLEQELREMKFHAFHAPEEQ